MKLLLDNISYRHICKTLFRKSADTLMCPDKYNDLKTVNQGQNADGIQFPDLIIYIHYSFF